MTVGRTVGVAGWLLVAGTVQGAGEGRWEGVAELPGQSVPVVVDLAPRGGAWVGAATLPGRGVSGAPLTALQVQGPTLRATIAGPPGMTEDGAIGLVLQMAPDNTVVSGQLQQAGHSAVLTLRRSGAAQLPAAPPASPWPPALDGTWRGHYDIGFGPREVTLRMGAAAAAMTVVGRRTTEVAFDEVRVLGAYLILRAAATDITIEAPAASARSGRLDATLRQGPFASRLPLQRGAAR
jgi:hypothetical protein